MQDPKISAPMKAQTTVNHSQSLMTMIPLPLEFKLPDIVMSQYIEKPMDIPQEIYTHTSDQVLVFINSKIWFVWMILDIVIAVRKEILR